MPAIVDLRPLLVLPGGISTFQIEVYIKPNAMAAVRLEPAQAASRRADVAYNNTWPLRMRLVPRGGDFHERPDSFRQAKRPLLFLPSDKAWPAWRQERIDLRIWLAANNRFCRRYCRRCCRRRSRRFRRWSFSQIRARHSVSNVQPFPAELFEIWLSGRQLSPFQFRMPGKKDNVGQFVRVAI